MYAATTSKRPSFFKTSFFKTYCYILLFKAVLSTKRWYREANLLAIKGWNIQGADILRKEVRTTLSHKYLFFSQLVLNSGTKSV